MARCAVLAALLLAGCGGDEERAAPPPPAPTPPTATAPSAPEPPPDSAAPTPEATSTPREPEKQEGGAGDEEAARVPLDFTIDGEGITPPRVEVPAFLALELAVRNDTPRAQRVTLGDTVVRVPAGGRRSVRRGGLRPGRYAVDAGAAGRATLVVGAEPGP
jgi:hypothetical protein